MFRAFVYVYNIDKTYTHHVHKCGEVQVAQDENKCDF